MLSQLKQTQFAIASTLLAGALLFPVSPARASIVVQANSNNKIEQQIEKAENQLKRAIAKCDPSSLDRLLTSYYADSFADDERAVGKKVTLARCRSRSLIYYEIEKDRKVSVRPGGIVVIEGISEARSAATANDVEAPEGETRVQRMWTRKNGRWQLVAQTLSLSEEKKNSSLRN